MRVSGTLMMLLIVQCITADNALWTMNFWTVHKNKDELIINPGSRFELECKGEGNMTWRSKPGYLTGLTSSSFNDHVSDGLSSDPRRLTSGVDTSLRAQIEWRYQPRRLILFMKNVSVTNTGTYLCMEDGQQKSSKDVYVFDEKNCNRQLFVPLSRDGMPNLKTMELGMPLLLPCRALHPRLNVSLEQGGYPASVEDTSASYDPREGFLLNEASLAFLGYWSCVAHYKDCSDRQHFYVHIGDQASDWVSRPMIAGPRDVAKAPNDTLNLECSVNSTGNINFDMFWRLPNGEKASQSKRITLQEMKHRALQANGDSVVINKLILNVYSICPENYGNYSCVVMHNFRNEFTDYVRVHVRDEDVVQFLEPITTIEIVLGSSLTVKPPNGSQNINDTVDTSNSSVQWVIPYRSHPDKISFRWFNPEMQELKTSSKYELSNNPTFTRTRLIIHDVQPEDAGVYVLQAKAGLASNSLNLTLVVKYPPRVRLEGLQDYLLIGRLYQVDCIMDSYPAGNISWSFRPCNSSVACREKRNLPFQEKQIQPIKGNQSLQFLARESGLLTCQACNTIDCTRNTSTAMVSEVDGGFRLYAPEEVLIGDKVSLGCAVPRFTCPKQNMSWQVQKKGTAHTALVATEKKVIIKSGESVYSFFSNLTFVQVSQSHAGHYSCQAKCDAGREYITSHLLTPQAQVLPQFINTKDVQETFKILEGNHVSMDCNATGTPRPDIMWIKDHEVLKPDSSPNNRVMIKGMVLVLQHVITSDDGQYMCIVRNRAGGTQRTFYLEVNPRKKVLSLTPFIALVVALCVLLLVAVIYLARRVTRERKKVRSFTAQEVQIFLDGAVDSIDPDLGLDQQADLLPYDPDYEFPREKLKLGRVLGSGAYGRVVKAEADGPLFGLDPYAEDGSERPASGPTIVAVKMVKPNGDVSHIKALMTELKFLTCIGKHLNIVNLLGACTTNLSKKELLVIVEYCRFGNIHSYLFRQRDQFLDQVDHLRDVIDFTIGSNANTNLYQNAGMDRRQNIHVSEDNQTVSFQPDRTGSDNADGKFQFNRALSNSSNASSLDNWGSEHWTPIRYRGDFHASEVSRVCTKDLICWSYQVARGMEYLATKQIVHSDLAARNLLLAENNVVKICDFGLARNLYKNTSYLKKSDDPLPVKWMAIESIRDRVFSIQSDVWSFGIVLWELFSLASTPYPGIAVDEHFLPKLLDDYRMEKPRYSNLEIYRIMRACWREKPSERPTFSDLICQIGGILDEKVRQMYLDLNGPYIRMNSMQLEYKNFFLSESARHSRMYLSGAEDKFTSNKLHAYQNASSSCTDGYEPRLLSVRQQDSFESEILSAASNTGTSTTSCLIQSISLQDDNLAMSYHNVGSGDFDRTCELVDKDKLRRTSLSEVGEPTSPPATDVVPSEDTESLLKGYLKMNPIQNQTKEAKVIEP